MPDIFQSKEFSSNDTGIFVLVCPLQEHIVIAKAKTKIYRIYNFFSKWHDSLMRLSFYDFLKKTKLLQDERDFCRNYKKNILKRHEAVKRLETLKYFSLWEKYDLIDGLDDRLKPKGYLKKKKNGTN